MSTIYGNIVGGARLTTDKTLTKSGKAADAKVTGKKMESLRTIVNGITTTKQQPEYFSDLANLGMFGEVYNIGDQFVVDWTDTSASKTYKYPFRLNHIGDVELEDGSVLTNRVYLQAHYAHPFGVQFSHQRAFFKMPEWAVGWYILLYNRNKMGK